MSDESDPPAPGAGDPAYKPEPGASAPDTRRRGPLAWMAANPVAANLIMIFLIVAGLMSAFKIKQETFPEFTLPIVVVGVGYPGASPAEVEQAVVLAAEEAVRELDDVKDIRSIAGEGFARLLIEFESDIDGNRALADVKTAIDRITSFPEDAERPNITLATNRVGAISLVFYGDEDERTLRAYAEKARDDLLRNDDITLVSLFGVRPREISVEVPQEELRRYGLTLDAVAQAIRSSSVEVPAGGVKAKSGEVLIRTAERRIKGNEFEDITVFSSPDGSEVQLGDIATVKDAFRETNQAAFYNGKRGIMLQVFRVGDQTPGRISEIVNAYANEQAAGLPEGIGIDVWADTSEFLEQRFDLLLRNARLGLLLVLLVLGLFLEVRLAFWVTLGIPISFIGSLLFIPPFDASINMISLFAFIVTLGLVVDDAIVVGEAVYKHRSDGMSPLKAAIAGVREVALPVSFAIITTLVAFAPLLFVSGGMGKFFRIIPIVVISVLLISWVESLFILPAHLAHSRGARKEGWRGKLHSYQQSFSRLVERFIQKRYVPALRVAVRHRYLTAVGGIAMLLLAFAPVAAGVLKWKFLPDIEQDIIVSTIRLPFGASIEDTEEVTQRVVAAARETLEELGGESKYSRGIFSQVGNDGALKVGTDPIGAGPGSHKAEVAAFLVPVADRPFGMLEFSALWRERVGEVAGVEAIRFEYTAGPSAGAPLQIELTHDDIDTLEIAATALAERVGSYTGVRDVDPGFSPGKEQLDFKVRPEAEALGVTPALLASQIRSAFYGAEAVRQQRGRDEVRVYVRLPEEERRSEHNIESFVIRTPGGGEIPLLQAAEVTRGRSYTDIRRRRSRRALAVSADVDPKRANATEIVANLRRTALPELLAAHPGLDYSLEGEQREQANMVADLKDGYLVALLTIFALLAIVFRSYVQPLIIMVVIPFGLIGAILGHMALGYDISVMSVMGIVALSGVVVNDSLILVVAVNRFREDGMDPFRAIIEGGARRFRPIVLTSLTTFFGLAPMLLETSVQARFMIPMAISLGFGVMFATFIMLLLVPAVYQIILDAEWAGRAFMGRGGAAPRRLPSSAGMS